MKDISSVNVNVLKTSQSPVVPNKVQNLSLSYRGQLTFILISATLKKS